MAKADGLDVAGLVEALATIERFNRALDAGRVTANDARRLLRLYARGQRLCSYGVATLARNLDDATELSAITGSSVPEARATIDTGNVLAGCSELDHALGAGELSLAQAGEIAAAEKAAPGSAAQLIDVAKTSGFHVLRDEARRVRLDAERHRDLAARQHEARRASTRSDPLGMIHIYLALEPHVGAPIVARAEAEAQRLLRAAKRAQRDNAASKQTAKRNGNDAGKDGVEPFAAYLADAYAAMLSGSGRGPTTRPELVVLVDHAVVRRGWRDVRAGERCHIPGIGPVAPDVAKEIARDAFLTGVFFDGKELRHIKRWSRSVPKEVATALALGPPPRFDGIACVDCGKRFRPELDHVHPMSLGGETSYSNTEYRCHACHEDKTERDRRVSPDRGTHATHVPSHRLRTDRRALAPGDRGGGRGGGHTRDLRDPRSHPSDREGRERRTRRGPAPWGLGTPS